MLYQSLREEVHAYTKQMVADGLAYGSQGNLSLYDPLSDVIAITPSALPYKDMKPDDICLIDLVGKAIDSKWKPTSEMALHQIFYQSRPGIQAVVHSHAPFSTTFGIINEPIPMILTEAATCLGGEVSIAPYARPGTWELATAALEAIGDGVAVVLANHGLVTIGNSLAQAYESTMAVETSARLAIMARSMGKIPSSLDPKEVKEIRSLYLENYHPARIR